MARLLLTIEPTYLGPLSVGTVSFVRLIAEHSRLPLAEAKEIVDRAVFEREQVEVPVDTAQAAHHLAIALRALNPPPDKSVRVVLEAADYPEYLATTCQMLAAAYPIGLGPADRDYAAVVTTLASGCSLRAAAHALELTFGRENGFAYNDVLKYAGSPAPEEDLDRVRTKLAPHGFEAWRAEGELP